MGGGEFALGAQIYFNSSLKFVSIFAITDQKQTNVIGLTCPQKFTNHKCLMAK